MSATLSHELDGLLAGQLGPVTRIAQHRTGRRPSPATIWRWCRKGLRGGVRLTAVFHSGAWHTTDRAFEQFLLDQTLAQQDRDPTGAADRSAASDDALRAAGLL